MARGPVAVALALAVALAAPPARAEDGAAKDEARRLLRDGNALLAGGDFAAALVKFRAAYAAFASPKILINIGTTLRSLGQEVEAAAVYERCLGEGATLAPAERAQVEKALAEIDARVARVTVDVDEPGALVLIDGQEVGTSPLARPTRVAPGAHRVEARKDGFAPSAQTLQAEAGTTPAIALRLAPAPPEATVARHAPAAPARTPSRERRTPPALAPWTALGVGLAAAAAGTYFGLRTIDRDVSPADAEAADAPAGAAFAVSGVALAGAAGLWLWRSW